MRKGEKIPPDGKPKRLRAVVADVEKQQAVVEAFRVSLLLDRPIPGNICGWS